MSIRNRPGVRAGGLAALLFGVGALAGCSSQPTQADASAPSHTVGTVVRVDGDVISLSADTQTGSELGQASTLRVHLDPSMATGLGPGQRVMIDASKDERGQWIGSAAKVLYAPDPPLAWGHYLHGKVSSISAKGDTVYVQQAESMRTLPVRYDATTEVVDLEGSPLAITGLAPGDEVDVALKATQPAYEAMRIVRLR